MNEDQFVGEEIGDELEDERQEIARSAHAGMLHDHERHLKYNLALKETILATFGKCDAIQVLDIGTGTGILSMMAAKMSDKVKVTACEMFKPIANLAHDIVKDNGYQNKIDIVNKSSNSLEIPHDLSCKADILVTEILDSELIGEGVIPTINDAHKKLLSDNACVIPAAAELHIQLIESDTLFKTHKLSSFSLPKSFSNCQGTANAHELQCSQLYPESIKLLSDAHTCTEIDFSKPYIHNKTKKQSMHQTVVNITQSGKLHAVVMWWNLILHRESNITLNMAPSWETQNDFVWRDHWMQCVYYLPNEMDVYAGNEISLNMHHDDYSVWFDVNNSKSLPSLSTSLRPMCNCGLHISFSHEMFSLWNSTDIISKWKLISKDLQIREEKIIVIGETSLVPLVMKQSGCDDVSYMECSQWSMNIASKISHWNDLQIKFINSVDEDRCTLVIDPFWSSNILPWHILNIVPLLQERNTIIAPTRFHLKAVVVRFTELWRIRSPVSSILDFNLSKFDDLISNVRCVLNDPELGEFHQAEPFSMVEYEHSIVSDVLTLVTFDLNDKSATQGRQRIVTQQIPLHETLSRTMALVVWMDYEILDTAFTTGLSESGDQSPWVRYSKQGVAFIPSQVSNKLVGSSSLTCNLLYRPSKDHDIIFSFI